ncbi:MAG TPA: sigma-70 family RNA polymerase sigma factor [Rhizomicrobium sp.]|nr:sigma-70 family RNA polymerase sigma factor [Rhizomicrobium sp.]
MNTSELEAWFVQDVLPLEAALMQFLQHNWRNRSDIADLRQDVYERVCQAAQEARPDNTRAFVFRTARNLLIDRIRREHVVPIEAVEDLDALAMAMDEPDPERTAIARDELRRLQLALDRLPPRAREAIVLGRIEGLQGNEIAIRMGITEGVVSRHLASGITALADMLYGENTKPRRTP